ncbi:MAG: hypothetical protein ABI776_05155 [Nocardioidaceae bacterium]
MAPERGRHAWPGRPGLTAFARSDLTLGVGMALGTALSYAFSLVVSRSLGPAGFGAFSAVIGFGLLGSIPAGALQVVVARRVVMRAPHAQAPVLAGMVGGGLLVAMTVLSPVLERVLHLPSVWPAVALGALLVPMTLTGVYQGLLLGRRRLGALAVLYVVTSLGRLLAGVAAALFGLSITELLFATVVMGALAAAWGGWVTRSDGQAVTGGSLLELGLEVLRSSWTLSSLIALTSVDVVLARHYLSRQASGEYALAALFGKVVFWGTQFVALVVVPRVTHDSGRRAVRPAVVAVAGLGLAVTAVLLPSPRWWVVAVGGPDYANAAGLAVAFSVVGTGWALLQVVLFGQMGRNRVGISGAVWTATVVELVLCVGWLHHSAAEVLASVGLAAVLALASGAVVATRGGPRPLLDDGA